MANFPKWLLSKDSGCIFADVRGLNKHPNFHMLIKTEPLNLSHTKRSNAREKERLRELMNKTYI